MQRGPGPAGVLQRPLPERLTPERCVEAYYLQRTRFQSIVEWKLRRRQFGEDGKSAIWALRVALASDASVP